MNCYSTHDLHGKFEFIKWCVIYRPHKYSFYTGVSGIWTKDFYLSILKIKKPFESYDYFNVIFTHS